jgi:hypothetical protein
MQSGQALDAAARRYIRLLSYTRLGKRFNSNSTAEYPRSGNVLVSGFSLLLRY